MRALRAVGAPPADDGTALAAGGHDFRLVPAAVTVWLAGLAGLLIAWWMAVVIGVVAVLAAGWLLRRRMPLVGLAGALLLAGLSAGGPLTLVLHESSADPLRAAADRGGAAVVRVTLTDRPRPVRTTGYAGQPASSSAVVVEGEVSTAQVDGAPVASTGRLLLVAPAQTWSQLLPGQELDASGALAPARPGQLLVAVLQVRGPPRDVSPASWWQRSAASVRASLRDASAVLDPEEAGLLPGLVVGDTGGMSRRVEEEFLDAGMSHLTAVSGAKA